MNKSAQRKEKKDKQQKASQTATRHLVLGWQRGCITQVRQADITVENNVRGKKGEP